MQDVPRRGNSWYIIVRNLIADRTRVEGDTPGAAVTYTLTHNGVSAGSGSLVWEDHDFTDAWVKRITLPSTPGILTIEVTANATVDGDLVTGSRQTSLKVV